VNITCQLTRFGIVGLANNLLLYLLYLLVTHAGVGYKLAMTILYALGVLITFLFNRNWSFLHDGALSKSLQRYLLLYLVAYMVNWCVLYLLVDLAGWPHQLIQGAMILLLAAALFLLQKFWVFNRETAP
jgi:putative flippase GtrA